VVQQTALTCLSPWFGILQLLLLIQAFEERMIREESSSGTWRKNDVRGTSDPKMKWSLQWEQFWKRFRFECFPKYVKNEPRDCMGRLHLREHV
jgi:hypothetical protein